MSENQRGCLVFLKWGIAALSILFVLGISISRYSATRPFLIGAAVTFVVILISKLLLRVGTIFSKAENGQQPDTRNDSSRTFIKVSLFLAGFVILSGLFCVGVLLFPRPMAMIAPYNFCEKPGETRDRYVLSNYSAEIEPADVDLENGEVVLEEEIVYNIVSERCGAENDMEGLTPYQWNVVAVQEGVGEKIATRIIPSEKVGYFSREVAFALEDNESLKGFECCPNEGEITLRNFPKSSFYDARYSTDIIVDEYLGKETVAYKVHSIEEGIHFAYLQPPFNDLRGLITPLLELSNSSNIFVAVAGIIVSWFTTNIILGSISDRIKKWFNRFLEKKEENESSGGL